MARPKGYVCSAETREKISAANKGQKRTAEARFKDSVARKGKKLSAETREKISAANKGKKLSAETRAKMSEANRGNKNRVAAPSWVPDDLVPEWRQILREQDEFAAARHIRALLADKRKEQQQDTRKGAAA